jgi:spermidine synthase
MIAVPSAAQILVLGGGDGMAVREILKYPDVEQVTLVELDPKMTELFSERPELIALNNAALLDPKVEIVHADAFQFLRERSASEKRFDVVIIDFPDPNNFSLGKLYTNYFYRMLQSALQPGAVVAIQSTSPIYSPSAFWCVAETLRHTGFVVRPYHAFVPAFGEWGFMLASISTPKWQRGLPEGLKYLDLEVLETLFVFPPDIQPKPVPINRLDNQALVQLYESDWHDMVHP